MANVVSNLDFSVVIYVWFEKGIFITYQVLNFLDKGAISFLGFLSVTVWATTPVLETVGCNEVDLLTDVVLYFNFSVGVDIWFKKRVFITN